MSEKIWLVTFQGTPTQLRWGAVKNPSEGSRAVLTSTEEADADYDATPTMWERAPTLAIDRIIDDVAASPTLVGRILTVAGIQYDLDGIGRPHPQPGASALAPDGVVNDQTAAVALAESLGVDLSIVEKTTNKHIHIYATQDPATPTPPGINSALYRQSSNNQVIRVEET